jgi:hypothetical protein
MRQLPHLSSLHGAELSAGITSPFYFAHYIDVMGRFHFYSLAYNSRKLQ